MFVGRPYKCPFCGSSENSGKGVRRTKLLGPRRIRRCKGCRRKFTPRSQKPISIVEVSAGSSDDAVTV